MTAVIIPFLTDYDIHLIAEGNHYHLYDKLGAHLVTREGATGVQFAVWAPNARKVWVIGEFNGWRPGANAMQPLGSSGVWETFIPGIRSGALYKYAILPQHGGHVVDKADP